MRRSHICTTCASELARVRACVDPTLGLPIVVCPQCNRAFVRTLGHPDSHDLSTLRRLLFVLFVLLIRCAFLILGAMLFAVTVYAAGANLGQGEWGDRALSEIQHLNREEMLWIVIMVAFCIIAGILARLTLSVRTSWGVLTGLLLIASLWVLFFEWLTLSARLPRANSVSSVPEHIWTLLIDAPEVLLLCSGAASLLAFLGIVITNLIRVVIRRTRPSPMRRALTRARRQHARRRTRGYA